MDDLNQGLIAGSTPTIATNVPREGIAADPMEQGIKQLQFMMEPVTVTRGQMLTIIQSIKALTTQIADLEAKLKWTKDPPHAVLD